MPDEDDKSTSRRQANFFFDTAIRTLAPHAKRFRREGVFLSLGDRVEIAVPLARVLIAAYKARPHGNVWRWAEQNNHAGWRYWQNTGRQASLLSQDYTYLSPDGREFTDERLAREHAESAAQVAISEDQRRQDTMRNAADAVIAQKPNAKGSLSKS